jgi:uncharacterized heparinase superfamily protein
MIASAGRWYHTVRHLKPVQIYGRLLFRVPRRAPTRAPSSQLRFASGPWADPVAKRPTMSGPNTFTFLGRSQEVASAAAWNTPALPKLWLYNLHYLDDLTAEGAPGRAGWHRSLLSRWTAENPPARGNGWEPYPVSLRAVNIIKWLQVTREPEAEWLRSLGIQAQWLERRLEWHLLGNHLLANAKALVYCGCFFHGADAERWLARGLQILERELREQILGDGGHFELSPMYHAIILEDVLDLINIALRYPNTIDDRTVSEWLAISRKMQRWLEAMTHPDGEIAFFNDAAFDIAPKAAELASYSGRLGSPPVHRSFDPLTHLDASGYVRFENAGAVAILDVGAVGPDYLPGHAHADTLSFELSVGATRLVVNSGTSEYALGYQRDFERSTAAHNTVEVDGNSSSETWGSFRVARRARPFDLRLDLTGDRVRVGCAHDGYRHHGVVHRRTWQLEPGSFAVQDQVSGPFKAAVARFYFSPRAHSGHLEVCSSGELDSGSEPVTWRSSAPGRIIGSEWHPRFGTSMTNSCLVIPLSGSELRTTFTW